MVTKTVTVVLDGIQCATCGIMFGVDVDTLRRRREDGAEFYCTAGHRNFFRETEITRLKRQLEREEARREAAHNRAVIAAREAATERRRAAAFKGQITKTKNRVANGVCPCCNRFFKNLHAHMKRQHPGYESS